MALGGGAAGGAAYAVSRAVASGLGTATLGASLLQVGAGIAAGVIAFLAVARAFRLEELRLIGDVLRSRIGRQ